MPRDSAYGEAMADDETIAAIMLDMPELASARRRMSEWSVQVELLTDLRDLTTELIGAVIASAGVKPGSLPRAPRPYTAVDRLRTKRRMARHRSLVARLLPDSRP